MSRLYYLGERDIHGIVAWLSRDMFPDTPAFQLAGAEGTARLESALAQPRWPHHRTAQRKAAALHYSLNKNHPFVDGNKRLAVAAMEWFLFRNNFAVMATNDHLLEFSLRVADNRLSHAASAQWIEAPAFRVTWSERRRAGWVAAWHESVPALEIRSVVTAISETGTTDFGRSLSSLIDRGLLAQ